MLTYDLWPRRKRFRRRLVARNGKESRFVRMSILDSEFVPTPPTIIISAILIGLIIMMWPVLTKVQYERLPTIFSQRNIWAHIGLSIFLNWILAPFIMLGLAWATLPEASLARERHGVLLVGVARCIGEPHC
jgi:hypothetical protein